MMLLFSRRIDGGTGSNCSKFAAKNQVVIYVIDEQSMLQMNIRAVKIHTYSKLLLGKWSV